MNWRIARAFAGVLVALGMVWLPEPRPVLACMCLGSTAASEWRRSEAIFHGRVLAIQEPVVLREGGIQVPRLSSTSFEVLRTWKGVDGSYVVVAADTSDCGINFHPGREYLVWAYRWPTDSGELIARSHRPPGPAAVSCRVSRSATEVRSAAGVPAPPAPRPRHPRRARWLALFAAR